MDSARRQAGKVLFGTLKNEVRRGYGAESGEYVTHRSTVTDEMYVWWLSHIKRKLPPIRQVFVRRGSKNPGVEAGVSSYGQAKRVKF